MPTDTCRAEHCQIAVDENGYFCRNDWREINLETKHLLLAFPPSHEPKGDSEEAKAWVSARNSALHKCLAELRIKLNIPSPDLEAVTTPQPNPKVDVELIKAGVEDPAASREGRAAKRAAKREPAG